mgnify:CR=1 FL=1
MTLIRSKKDKEEFVSLISDAFQQVMVPALDNAIVNLKQELSSKEDVREVGMKVDSLDRKFDAQQERQDRHNSRIEVLEKIHHQGRHLATV